ncbi:hypothetical protein niasHT_015666 [Heterodera trifolii]|uniref:Exportin-4 n=1 Tax=Heterodera trifolii TaxID=157864 RepID=A0ABD2L4A7_9BILA
MAVSISNELSKLEFAAQVIMAPPNQVTSQDRKDAEALFMSLREGVISVEHCRQSLEATKNHFLMFELTRALVARLLKEWAQFSLDDVSNICDYLFNFPAVHTDLPSFVTTEMFHSAAMVVKRASLSSDRLFLDLLAKLEGLLNSGNQQLQAFGLQIIELVATEFNTTWRASAHSISWDFHRMAKKEFEKVMLKQLLKLALNTLSRLLNSSDLSSAFDQQVCDKFLSVASLIFCWNFQPKHLFLDFRILFHAFRANSFRPPQDWHELFQDASIVTFFMQLHSRVRYNQQLCQNSLTCLAQLASAMGDSLSLGPFTLVIPQVSSDLSERRLATSMGGAVENLSEELSTHDLYVRTFSRELVQLFSGLVLDHEMASLSLIIYKLLSCQPIPVFKRFPADLLRSFVEFVSSNIVTLVEPSMQLALKNDHTYHEPLVNFFFAWRTLLRTLNNDNEFGINEFVRLQTQKIIECFFKSVFSPPFGNRTKISDNEIFEENEEEEDDQKTFMDLLIDLGHFSLHTIDFFTDFVIGALVQRLRELCSMDVGTCTNDQLMTWQEDFHWLLLIIDSFIWQPSYSNIGNYPEELALRCLNGYKSGEFVKLDDSESLFCACLANPPFDPATYPGKLDPVTLIATQILSWFSLEHQMLVKLGPGASLLSPTLCETSFSNFNNLLVLLTPSVYWSAESPQNNEEDEDRERNSEIKSLPTIPRGGNLSSQIIQLSLDKFVQILTKMPSEKNLCKSAIALIRNFAENRPQDLATNQHLYTVLSELNIEKLPSRRELIKAMILLGQMNEKRHCRTENEPSFEEQIGSKVKATTLDPLMSRFLALCATKRNCSDESALADYFECFAGVAESGQSDTADTLFAFLLPAFQHCVPLIIAHPDSRVLVAAILDFIKSATDLLFFHVDHGADLPYHQFLIDLINAYKQTQFHRFRSGVFALRGDSSEEEQQTQDLSSLIEILCLFHSKTYVPPLSVTESECLAGREKISMHGLELLLPLMTEELLNVPHLCASFFRLLIFVSDIAAEGIAQSPPQMLDDILRCVKAALDYSFGGDRVRSALEIVNGLAANCVEDSVKKTGKYATMTERLLALVPKMFQLAMEYSFELDLLSDASSALFSLILLGPDSFKAFVTHLLNLPSNQENRERLEEAFSQLLTPFPGVDDISFPVQPHSQLNRRFQRNFEDFLIRVSGCLCLN